MKDFEDYFVLSVLTPKSSISFHKFRHTYATNYLENGANIEFVRETLGHAKITTTQEYLHLSNNHLKEQHSKYSPINKIR
ncbi:tyrosine-type recombinase/integrase [Mycoplasmatota bacterium]|nr:tyrosine-type recombinase/integrase [Mycoplasmatota bacterium]